MTLDQLEKLCAEARDERWMSDFLKASIDIIPNLIAVARVAEEIYASSREMPNQETCVRTLSIADLGVALGALEKP